MVSKSSRSPGRPMRAERSTLPLRSPRPAPAVCGLFAALLGPVGCTALATSPEWTGGGLALSAPLREAEEDAELDRERAIIASQPAKIGARHLLVMHVKSDNVPEDITRTREEAQKRAQECLVKIRGGEPFESVVKECSDEPGAAERGGDLGIFSRNRMVKPFADAAFALKINEVSEVIETSFGFHVIQRTE